MKIPPVVLVAAAYEEFAERLYFAFPGLANGTAVDANALTEHVRLDLALLDKALAAAGQPIPVRPDTEGE